MIRSLHLRDVGPASALDLQLSPRLNVLTGDNGLGKTFALEALWWLITETWLGEESVPRDDRAGREPWMWAELGQPDGRPTEGSWASASRFDGFWRRGPARADAGLPRFETPPPRSERFDLLPPLAIAVGISGEIAIWDHLMADPEQTWPVGAIHLSTTEVWDGRTERDSRGRERIVCPGLVADWVSWQGTRAPAFDRLCSVLETLSVPGEPLTPAAPQRVRKDDRRYIPTLHTTYGRIPVTLASAGVRRVLSLAYAMVWAWQEHQELARLAQRPPTREMLLIIDEVELHLHPQWQRVLVPALLRTVRHLSPEVAIQIVATTHAPLVLASLEPLFVPGQDTLLSFDVDPERGEVVIEQPPWRRRGDVSNWLTSEYFDLGVARSREAEEAILKARAAIEASDLPHEEARTIYRELLQVLGDTDPFWVQWRAYAAHRGEEP